MNLSEKKEREKIIERMLFWFPLCFPIAPLSGIVYTILRITRRVKIKGLERLRFKGGGMILIAPHFPRKTTWKNKAKYPNSKRNYNGRSLAASRSTRRRR